MNLFLFPVIGGAVGLLIWFFVFRPAEKRRQALFDSILKRHSITMPSVDIARMAEELATMRALAKSQGDLALEYKAQLNQIGTDWGIEIRKARQEALDEAEKTCLAKADEPDMSVRSQNAYVACADSIAALKNL